ncbi:hypothetical protein RPB_3307 [Rhodopseudomonas palustris HaA2]|uniref:Uncharacterized protein n=1 Tax=Rhodopseudomonas palustris (strain HaA2) TaxID=316058 RepID=Q2IUV7_RHOP2|nr:hypothetical protein [Rhodopseudomonas palustris]ABD08003.1 hypothetical protein RPB_3307 [Rhodopseudomonas palustris HaA2]
MAKIDLIGSEIENLTDYFNRTSNPAAAWRVFSLCRKTDRPVPAVITAEIDRFAEGVADAAEQAMMAEVGAKPVQFRPAELGKLWRGPCKGNPVGAMQDEWRDYQIYWAVRGLVNNGTKVGDAQEAVAKRKGVGLSKDTVDRIWKRHNRNG